MPQCGPVRLAASPPACDGATVVLRGPAWSGLVHQQSGAKQLGYLRAWPRLKKPSRDSCRLHEAIALGTAYLRTSTSTVAAQRTIAGRDAAMVYARLPLHWHANERSTSTVAGRVASTAQRKRTQTDSAARAPRTVRDSTKVVVPLVLDELHAWPARRAMLIRAARLCTDAVREAIRPSTVR